VERSIHAKNQLGSSCRFDRTYNTGLWQTVRQTQTHDESKYPAGIVKIGKSLKWLRDVDATERTPFGNLSCMS